MNKYGVVAVCLILVCWPIYAAITAPKLPAEVDCMLVQYQGKNYQPGLDIGKDWLKKGCPRVITYPDGYVPILVPEDKVEVVKKVLGKDRVLRLSPGLE